MTKILEEVRQISSDAIAQKQNSAENKLPSLIKEIKGAAALGKTTCEFLEHQVDVYSKKLLEVEGFRVYATTRIPSERERMLRYGQNGSISIWVVSW